MPATSEQVQHYSHHDQLPITVNENCAIPVPDDLLQYFLKPHKLSFYYFVFMDEGSEQYKVDLQDITLSSSQLVFGVPNQIFTNPKKTADHLNYKIGFDEQMLALLPQPYPFLVNPLNTNLILFDAVAKQRVKAVFSILFQLLHAPGKQKSTEIILTYVNTLLTEFNTAYFGQANQHHVANPKLSKYIAFKLAVEDQLTEQHDVHSIAEKLDISTNSLYGIVKEFSGVSPKEWMTNRLILEAQRKLQYSTLSVKELAYELGFNDPGYFSRMFKKETGKSVTEFLSELQDLSAK